MVESSATVRCVKIVADTYPGGSNVAPVTVLRDYQLGVALRRLYLSFRDHPVDLKCLAFPPFLELLGLDFNGTDNRLEVQKLDGINPRPWFSPWNAQRIATLSR